jgi:hypothetical protein
VAVFFILSMLPSCVASQLDPVATCLQSTVAEADSAAAKPDSVDVKLDLMVLKLDLMPMMVDLVGGGARIGGKGASLLPKSRSDCHGEEEERAGSGGQTAMGSTKARAGGRRTAETTWELGSSDDNNGAGRLYEEWQREIESWVAERHGHIGESSSRYFC